MNAVVSFEDSVKERIKTIVAELIPEEKWQALVDKQIKEFEQVSLPKLINEELTTMFREQIRQHLCDPEFMRSNWVNNGQQIDGKIKDMLVEAAPLMFAQVLSNMTYNVLNNLRNQTPKVY